jgi:hypothetical protein
MNGQRLDWRKAKTPKLAGQAIEEVSLLGAIEDRDVLGEIERNRKQRNKHTQSHWLKTTEQVETYKRRNRPDSAEEIRLKAILGSREFVGLKFEPKIPEGEFDRNYVCRRMKVRVVMQSEVPGDQILISPGRTSGFEWRKILLAREAVAGANGAVFCSILSKVMDEQMAAQKQRKQNDA